MKPHWMFNCHEVSILVSKSIDEELPLLQRMAVRFHIMMCNLCSVKKNELFKLHELTKMFRKKSVDSEPYFHLSEKSKTKLKDALRKH